MKKRSPNGGALSIREVLATQTELELINRFLGGEERAFQELVERYQTRLLNFIYRTIGDREKAEDLVQETFIRIYRHLHRFDRDKKFSTWAYTIASNLAKNELRNRSRNPLVLFQTIQGNWEDEDRPLQFEDTQARPDDMFNKRHLRELVDDAVALLPMHHRSVFIMRELEGKSYEEIADETDTNLGTVKSRLNRARNAFAELIEDHIEPEEFSLSKTLPSNGVLTMPTETAVRPTQPSTNGAAPDGLRDTLRGVFMWWLDLENAHIVFQILKPSKKFDDFANIFSHIHAEIWQRNAKRALPPTSLMTKALPVIRQIAERAKQMRLPNVPAVPGSEPETLQPPDNDMSGKYSGSNNRRRVESESAVVKRPQTKDELEHEKARIRAKLVEYLGRPANWEVLQSTTYSHFCKSAGMSLARNEFNIMFSEVNAELKQLRRTVRAASTNGSAPHVEPASSVVGTIAPATPAVPIALVTPPSPANTSANTTMPAKIVWLAENGKHGQMYAADRIQLESMLSKLLVAEPTITVQKAYSHLKPPVSEVTFKKHFAAAQSRLAPSADAEEVVATEALPVFEPEAAAETTKAEVPTIAEVTSATTIEAAEPATTVEDAPAKQARKSIRLRSDEVFFRAVPNDDGTWAVEQHYRSLDALTMLKMLELAGQLMTQA
jgi:RNA polymerase sigma-70 factor (ECF subfamily)